MKKKRRTMNKIIAIILISVIMLLAGCSEAYEQTSDESHEAEMHWMILPQPGGGVTTIPIWY